MTQHNRPKQQLNPIDQPDTNNATYIGWEDFPRDEKWQTDYYPSNKRDYYCYLDRLNSGLQNGPRWQNKRYKTFKLARHLILCLASELRMDEWTTAKAVSIFIGIDRSKLGVRLAISGFCTCAYVIHEYIPRRNCHPRTNENKFDQLVTKGRMGHNITKKRYESVYGKIADRVRRGELNPPKHDAYEVDTDGQRAWRQINADADDGWL